MPRGGKRPGAGRPRAPRSGADRLVTKSIALTEAHCRKLADLAEYGACSESEIVRIAIDLAYAARKAGDQDGSE